MTSAAQEQVQVIPDWTLGWRLQRALAHAELSVEEMAGDLGVTRSTISRWMHDRGAPPRPIYVRQWALRTGISERWLEDAVNGTTGSYFPAERHLVVVQPQVTDTPTLDTSGHLVPAHHVASVTRLATPVRPSHISIVA